VLESVSELRLEMVCSKAALPLAIETLRQFHPYEEPPIDVYELLPKPTRGIGSGRRVALDRPTPIRVLAERMKKHIGRSVVRVATTDLDQPVSVIGVCCGAGAELASVASAEGCELFITGEMRHHEIAGWRSCSANTPVPSVATCLGWPSAWKPCCRASRASSRRAMRTR
jgi:putative NIF3 family GTP cyclohydrolase 1 type 2